MKRRQTSRYEEVSRRALLKGAAGLGVVSLVPGLACGSSDEQVFADSTAQVTTEQRDAVPTDAASTASVEPAAATSSESSVEPTAVQQATLQPLDESTTAPAVAATTALPAATEMVIGFTYNQSPGGKNLPPYIAVWIENTDGELLETVALWFQQDDKGPRWLPDLKRWYTQDQQRISDGGPEQVDVVSSATRLAGSYSLAWDGSAQAQPLVPGDYFVCIESARERGPYSLIREPLTLSGQTLNTSLPDHGELINASIAIAA